MQRSSLFRQFPRPVGEGWVRVILSFRLDWNRYASFLMTIALFLCCTAALSFASGVIDLPQTGQTTCYDPLGGVIACTNTGQDADWQAGVLWPNPRFVSGTGVEANCLTDKLTGLMWPKNGNLANGTRTWQGALDYANGLTLCGHSDWRLPNVIELKSLENTEEPDTAVWLNTQGFKSVQSREYWSSSTMAYWPNSAWRVHMRYGGAVIDHKGNNDYVLPVRSGQSGSFGSSTVDLPSTGQATCYDTAGSVIGCAGTGQDGEFQAGVAWPDPRFVSGTGTEANCMIDKLTGLMWPKNGNQGETSWIDALSIANNLTLCGHTDWRLPNVIELRSLVNDEKSDTASWLNTQGFNSVQSNGYWSSSNVANDPSNVWIAFMLSGVVNVEYMYYGRYVLPVRGGQSAKLPPVAPEALKATANTSGKITLTWQDKSIYETGYKVFRKAGTGAFALLKNLPADKETYIDSTAAGNDTTIAYSYYVKACNAAGCSKNTPVAVVPYKPTNLAVTKVTNGAKLSWTDKSTNEKGFQIYRKAGTCTSTNPFQLIKTTAANAATFTNTGIAPGTYSYKVRALTQSALQPYSYGFSTFSNCVIVTVP